MIDEQDRAVLFDHDPRHAAQRFAKSRRRIAGRSHRLLYARDIFGDDVRVADLEQNTFF